MEFAQPLELAIIGMSKNLVDSEDKNSFQIGGKPYSKQTPAFLAVQSIGTIKIR